jgi:hypothetical protein
MAMYFTGTITKDGRLILDDREGFQVSLQKFAEKKVDVIVKPRSRPKTPNQNRYFHGVVVPFIAEQMGHRADSPFENDQVREYLKERCGVKMVFRFGFMETFVPKSISLYTVEDYKILIDGCGELCQKFFNCVLPPPDSDYAKERML